MLNNSNVFGNPFLNKTNDMGDIYEKIEALKSQQMLTQKQQNIKTAYDEFRDLYKEMSADERRYIESSDAFITANAEYQNAFSNFLIDKLGDEFLQSKYGSALEKSIGVIKQKREEYHNNMANDISAIKEQNAALAVKNEELAKHNEEMSQLIKSLQDKLWVNNDKR